MKATIDVPDEVYRRVKAKSALEGRPVRDVAVELFRNWIAETRTAPRRGQRVEGDETNRPAWFGALRRYAANARGRHDMKSIRQSIARGRARDQALRKNGDD
ncbi:MAG: hypothetical protein ACREQQ_19130 [Candidatus Binatia bacterium]